MIVDSAGGSLAAIKQVLRAGRDNLLAERDRWFLWLPVAFGFGIAIYFALPDEPSLVLAVLPCAVLLVLARHIWHWPVLHLIAMAVAACAVGFARTKVAAERVSAPVLEQRLFRAQVAGFIERVEPRNARGPRVTIRVTALAKLPPARRPYRIRVRFMKRVPHLTPGLAIRFKAVLAPPPPPALPGGYDFARTAYFYRLGAVGYTHQTPEIISPAPPAPVLLRLEAAVQRARQRIAKRITMAVPGETGAIANALMTGERGNITKPTLDAYRASGVLHVLSISGLHMAIMAGAVFLAVRLLLASSPTLALTYPIKKWAAGIAIVAALAYLTISGATHATQRAFIMVLVMMLAIVLDRPAIAMRNVALAALAILLVQPASLLNVGFQMSFAAVVALVAAYEFVRDQRGETRPVPRGWLMTAVLFMLGIVATTLVASTAVAPISAYHFQTGQLYGVLTNLIVVPLCNFIIMPAALCAFVLMPFGLDGLALWVMAKGIDLMTWTAVGVAGLPGAVAHIPAFSPLAFTGLIVGGLWLCLWRRRWRILGLVPVAVGLALAAAPVQPDILVGRNGRLVAVRQPDLQLAALSRRGTSFELAKWLEHDGDARRPREVRRERRFRCDEVGCTIRHRAGLIAVSRQPASLIDDCARARLLILRYPKPPACNPRGHVIDFWRLREDGTHAISVAQDGALAIQTVRAHRGNRPWVQPRRRSRLRRSRQAPASKRLQAFAPGAALRQRDGQNLRPDIEPDQDYWRDE